MIYSFFYERSPTLHRLILYEEEERQNNRESQRGTRPGFCSTQVKQEQNSNSRLCSNAYLIILCKMRKPAQEGFRGLPAQKILALFWNVVNMGQRRSLKSSRVCFNVRLLKKGKAPLPSPGQLQVGERKKRLSVLWVGASLQPENEVSVFHCLCWEPGQDLN